MRKKLTLIGDVNDSTSGSILRRSGTGSVLGGNSTNIDPMT